MKLTKAEEQIMQILWKMGDRTVQDVLLHFDEEKPARTTVATVLSVLEKKGFVEHRAQGRINIYAPLVTREQYSRRQLRGFVHDYFNGSASAMFSLFAEDADMSIEDLDRIMEEVRDSLKVRQS